MPELAVWLELCLLTAEDSRGLIRPLGGPAGWVDRFRAATGGGRTTECAIAGELDSALVGRLTRWDRASDRRWPVSKLTQTLAAAMANPTAETQVAQSPDPGIYRLPQPSGARYERLRSCLGALPPAVDPARLDLREASLRLERIVATPADRNEVEYLFSLMVDTVNQSTIDGNR